MTKYKALGSAFLLDTWRSWLRAWKPFLSIMIISMLGVAVLTGIYAGCRDTFMAANRFYERQGLHDVEVVSTMGLTDEDVDALRGVDGVDDAAGVHIERVTIDGEDGHRLNATLREPASMDVPYVREGRLPGAAGEVAVTEQFAHDTHDYIGGTIDVTAVSGGDGDEAAHALTIVGIVTDPSDLSNPEGYSGSVFRSAVANDYTCYVAPGALEKTFGADPDVYGAIVMRLERTENTDAFSDDYDALVSSTVSRIENGVQSKREQARRESLQSAVQSELTRAKEQAYGELNGAQAKLDAQRSQLDEQLKALDAQAAHVPTGMAMPEPLASAQRQWAQADARLKEAQQQLNTQHKDINDRFAKEQQTIDDIAPRWYVQSRTALSGFSSLKSDISSIQSLGNAFPIVFLVVAVMMSLTTMSRLVEEDRGLIGTYLGLGYGRVTITLRYALFALLACLIGGGLGLLIGFLGIPAFLLRVIQGLYAIPDLTLEYDWLYGSLGILLFVVGVLGAALFASIRDMRQMPAALMRPKAPKAGSRILLERIRPLWKRMSFLNKVTARNIFRFKSRLIMTVGGVAGCAALILCGLAINDTVAALGPNQYRGVDQYDMFAMTNDGDEDELRGKLVQDGKTTAIMETRIESGEITNGEGSSTSVQLTIIPQTQLGELNTMFRLEPARSSSIFGWVHGGGHAQPVALGDGGIIVTQSAAQSLDVKAGDEVDLRGEGTQPHRVKVAAVTRSLIGAETFISEDLYHRLFPAAQLGEAASEQPAITWNAVYAKLKGGSDEQIAYVDRLEDDAIVLSATSTAYQAEHFKFDLMGAVVGLIVLLAGSLALVVLFTLAHTNVSERMREMATLKVLGFYDNEVHHYVNREMMTLTVMGVIVGLPLGRWVAGLLTGVLNMPGLYFEVHIAWWSYAITVVATIAFALLVQLFVNPVLDRIDPVGSLKAVE
ncbi:ABC transporter permease [Bifidobacterium pseudolongum subsp. pseudolongum]|uniref:ABC transporter permease n=1 Tax=Bifidobacterium pseudolongum subsp. pseudolongum TaxID=31954 RepID=A0A4Q5AB71_9BIFI|nr:ABC transporter permease [Bifidobacterium pseudolongum]RYQ23472.1 ABC transporter permease [Bifidobacterium pseudolongum subsp. pseudolongum]